MPDRPPRIYLDHNATTFPYPEVVQEVARVASSTWANPSSLHLEGRLARKCLDDSRERIARSLGVAPREVFFTSGATESNNLVLASLLTRPAGAGATLVTSAIEHPSLLSPAKHLVERSHAVRFLGVVRDGRVSPSEVAEFLSERPRLLSVMAANNETGALQPIHDLARLADQAKVPLHVDATQIPGRLPFDLASLPVAFISLSGHKFHGPRGIGLFIAREGAEFEPLLRGGLQERSRRPGTENVPAAAGLALALELATARLDERVICLRELRERLWSRLVLFEPAPLRIGDPEFTLPNTLSVVFPGASAETLLLALDLEGIAVSTGSACSSGAALPSHVLLAMGLSRRSALSSLRFSVDVSNTRDEIDTCAEILRDSLARQARGRVGARFPVDSRPRS